MPINRLEDFKYISNISLIMCKVGPGDVYQANERISKTILEVYGDLNILWDPTLISFVSCAY